MILDTPIEIHEDIFVKREDLCCPEPGPPFSKVRGIYEYFKHLKETGTNTVGYTETSISMAGWGVAWASSLLGMKAVIFDPQYKKTPDVLAYHRIQWNKFGAEIIPIPAGMAKVNWYISRKLLVEKYPHANHLPLGLPFAETVEETAKVVRKTLKTFPRFPSIVMCVGSGTIAAGVLKGLDQLRYQATIYGVLCRTGNLLNKKSSIHHKASVLDAGLFSPRADLELKDEGWEYTDKSDAPCPFPCHPYYDRKAWEWLLKNKHKLAGPILFWNIGH